MIKFRRFDEIYIYSDLNCPGSLNWKGWNPERIKDVAFHVCLIICFININLMSDSQNIPAKKVLNIYIFYYGTMGENINIMLEEYRTLRQEILQCVKTQYNICVAEATTIFGAAVSVVALKNLGGEQIYTVFLGVPLIFIIFTSLWITEQSRMMRAGNYIQLLENEINNEQKNICLFWENSLRFKLKPRFSQEHYMSQFVGVIGSFIIVSIFSLWTIWSHQIISDMISKIIVIIYSIFIAYILILLLRIINHQPLNIQDYLKQKDEYINGLEKFKIYNLKIKD